MPKITNWQITQITNAKLPKLQITQFLNRQIAQITNSPNYKCSNWKLPYF